MRRSPLKGKEALIEDDSEPPGARPAQKALAVLPESQPLSNDSLIFISPSTSRVRRRYDCIKASPRSREFQRKYFPEATPDDWSDWRWQIKSRIRNFEQLQKIINVSEAEKAAITRRSGPLPLGVTPYYAALLDRDNVAQPLRRTVVPVGDEFIVSPGEANDPLEEDSHSPVPGLVHRYPDRVLFLVSAFCSTYCRYCTRSRAVGNFEDYVFNKRQWEVALEYIENTPTIRDVLLSGGDPLTLADDKLEYLLTRLRAIKHVEFVRIGTKVPAVLPQRVTLSLTRILKKFHPLWMSIHFTHPDELTPEVSQACARLADVGIPLGSQTVLLKGINDNVPTMKELMHGLLKIRVKPYYLYQCDPISGSAHFRTSIAKGLEIIEGLRGHTTGYAVPTFVVDAPGGGGKIPILPEYYIGREGKDVLLRNYEGRIFRYSEPENC